MNKWMNEKIFSKNDWVIGHEKLKIIFEQLLSFELKNFFDWCIKFAMNGKTKRKMIIKNGKLFKKLYKERRRKSRKIVRLLFVV